MDTLAIPVKEEGANVVENFIELKQRAICQIYHVFNSATRAVIINKELLNIYSILEEQIIIKVLTSAWMRRLWTLQEAFLSRRLSVAFRKSKNDFSLEDIDTQIVTVGLSARLSALVT